MSHIVFVGNYTNKKGQTKPWLYVREGNNTDTSKKVWGDALLTPAHCQAMLDNLDTVKSWAANGSQKPAPKATTPKPVIVPPAPVLMAAPAPVPEPEEVEIPEEEVVEAAVDTAIAAILTVGTPLTPQQRLAALRAKVKSNTAVAAAAPEPVAVAVAPAAPVEPKPAATPAPAAPAPKAPSAAQARIAALIGKATSKFASVA